MLNIDKLQKMREDALSTIDAEKKNLSKIEQDIINAKQADEAYKIGFEIGRLYAATVAGIIDAGVTDEDAAELMRIIIESAIYGG